jgi:hypothetical protein
MTNPGWCSAIPGSPFVPGEAGRRGAGEGLVFPPFGYGRGSALIRANQGEIETEGMGVMASDMGYERWGMPNLEILHYSDE